MARVSLFKRWKKTDIKGELINTVHDSIVIDCPSKEVGRWVELTNNVFNDLPGNINRLYPDANFNLPIKVEIAVGNNQKDLTEIE
jgi:DNA polymerase I-like protein with 3'-5' exonuclease and polymerase domains